MDNFLKIITKSCNLCRTIYVSNSMETINKNYPKNVRIINVNTEELIAQLPSVAIPNWDFSLEFGDVIGTDINKYRIFKVGFTSESYDEAGNLLNEELFDYKKGENTTDFNYTTYFVEKA